MLKEHKILVVLILMILTASGLLAWHILGSSILDISHNSADILDKFAVPTSAITPLPVSADNIISLSKGRATSLAISKDTNEVWYYEKNTGKVMGIGFNGAKERVISATPLPNFLRTVWAGSMKEVISFFADATTLVLKHYHYTTKKATLLPLGTTLAVFSPQGNQIASFEKGAEQSTISIGTLTARKKLLDTRSDVVNLAWPSEQALALTMGSESGRAALFVLNMAGELKRISDLETGLESTWSRDGNRVLISYFDTDSVLHLVMRDLVQGKDTPISPASRAGQCAWSIDGITIICGIDDGGQDISQTVSQNLEKITIATGERTRIPMNTQKSVSIEEILLSPLEDYVVFINAFDHKLYSVRF